MRLTREDKVRFWSKVNKTNYCWNWTGSIIQGGYGQISISDSMTLVHRVAYSLSHGEIPDRMLVLHKCDNPKCVRLDHLFLGTQKDNMQDMIKKGRKASQKGEKHSRSKLTEKQVLEIRSKYVPWKYSKPILAKEYNVSVKTIGMIVYRKTWKHI